MWNDDVDDDDDELPAVLFCTVSGPTAFPVPASVAYVNGHLRCGRYRPPPKGTSVWSVESHRRCWTVTSTPYTQHDLSAEPPQHCELAATWRIRQNPSFRSSRLTLVILTRLVQPGVVSSAVPVSVPVPVPVPCGGPFW